VEFLFLGFAVLLSVVSLAQFRELRKIVERLNRENQKQVTDLLDRIMFIQGRPWASPPRDEVVRPVEETEQPKLDWRDY